MKPALSLAELLGQGIPKKPGRPTRTLIRMKDGTQCVDIDGKYHVWLPDNGGTVGPEYKLPKDPMAALQNALVPELCERTWHPPLAPLYRIASYNVMADVFSPPSQFPHHAPERVGWMYRGPRIAAEIAKVNPTILCLQELGVDEEGAHIRPLLTRSGYEGVFKPNAWKEGCAVFWQQDAFEKVEAQTFDFPTLAKALLARAKDSNDVMVVKLCEEMLKIRHHSVAVIAVLKEKRSKHMVAVLTSHLYWGAAPSLNYQLQLLQAYLALKELHSMCAKQPVQPAVFFCGDFNSAPTGGLKKFIEEGTLLPTHPDWKYADEPSSSTLAHKFSFASAYEPLSHPITHADDSFRACIDYIYHSKKVEPIGLLQLPQITKESPLPNNDYASDHLMIAMQFVLSYSQETERNVL